MRLTIPEFATLIRKTRRAVHSWVASGRPLSFKAKAERDITSGSARPRWVIIISEDDYKAALDVSKEIQRTVAARERFASEGSR